MIKVAILGCGMMGQEHISYIQKYDELIIKYICDPNSESIETAFSMIETNTKNKDNLPRIISNEKKLLEHVHEIDLLVIATPNYMHTPQIIRWGQYEITILVEKPVAISEKQVSALKAARPGLRANIWVGMEYRFIPAINKLLQLLPDVGSIKKVTIRENRYPFLSKIEEWNKDVEKSGDTLVEKCCHFFDLFRLISGQEMNSCLSKVHRGLLWDHYGYEVKDRDEVIPIIDSAYVLLDFRSKNELNTCGRTLKNSRMKLSQTSTLGCLELCMFAEGSRHQEEIIVTGMRGRVEAYLPENKVFLYQRQTPKASWKDKSKPPPKDSFSENIFDCSDLGKVYNFGSELQSIHSGYHYCSTAIEWKYLLDAIKTNREGCPFEPKVNLEDGYKAVEMGIAAMKNITNYGESNVDAMPPVTAFSSESSENLLDLVLSSMVNCDGEYKANPP